MMVFGGLATTALGRPQQLAQFSLPMAQPDQSLGEVLGPAASGLISEFISFRVAWRLICGAFLVASLVVNRSRRWGLWLRSPNAQTGPLMPTKDRLGGRER